MLNLALITGVLAAEELAYNPEDVTPGVVGFAFTGIVAFAVILLVIDMNRRVRRMRYREEVREALAAELLEQGRDADAATVLAGGTLDASAEQARVAPAAPQPAQKSAPAQAEAPEAGAH